MNVILTQDIETLGKAGTVVKVKAGYARNYLLPRSLAIPATLSSLKRLEHQKQVATARNARFVKAAREKAAELEKHVLDFRRRAGEEGKLFGSVTSIDIHRELVERGQDVDRRAIHLEEPIKTLGEQEIRIRLAAEVHAVVKVRVLADEPT